MPTPTGVGGFDSVKHLLSIVVNTQALIVRNVFRDITDSDLEIASKIQSSNQGINKADERYSKMAMKLACTPTKDDSIQVVILKIFLFYFIFRRARELYPEIYGMPNLNLHENLRFVPQVKLYFKEHSSDVDPEYSAIDAEITFRLTGESPETITDITVSNIAEKIYQIFAGSSGFLYSWKKGQVKLTYRHSELGYNFQVNCYSSTDGLQVIQDILKIRNHPYDPLRVTKSEPGASFPTIPGETIILGKKRRLPRQRPTGTVHFRYAELHIHGLTHPITLVDVTGLKKGALKRVSPYDVVYS